MQTGGLGGDTLSPGHLTGTSAVRGLQPGQQLGAPAGRARGKPQNRGGPGSRGHCRRLQETSGSGKLGNPGPGAGPGPQDPGWD